MTTYICDECQAPVAPDTAVIAWIRHYNDPTQWVDLMWFCAPCATTKGWDREALPSGDDAFLATQRQLVTWLQLTTG